MVLSISSYLVYVENGLPQFIQRVDGANIPIDPKNRDYIQFCKVDTEKRLCPRQTVPAPAISTGKTLEGRLAALEAGQKTIAAKVGVTLVSREIA